MLSLNSTFHTFLCIDSVPQMKIKPVSALRGSPAHHLSYILLLYSQGEILHVPHSVTSACLAGGCSNFRLFVTFIFFKIFKLIYFAVETQSPSEILSLNLLQLLALFLSSFSYHSATFSF